MVSRIIIVHQIPGVSYHNPLWVGCHNDAPPLLEVGAAFALKAVFLALHTCALHDTSSESPSANCGFFEVSFMLLWFSYCAAGTGTSLAL